MSLSDKQREVIDGMPAQNVARLVKDLESPESLAMHPMTFFLAMHPDFSTVEVPCLIEYCHESIKQREVTE